jgi:hypothetical protein
MPKETCPGSGPTPIRGKDFEVRGFDWKLGLNNLKRSETLSLDADRSSIRENWFDAKIGAI